MMDVGEGLMTNSNKLDIAVGRILALKSSKSLHFWMRSVNGCSKEIEFENKLFGFDISNAMIRLKLIRY